MRELVEFQVDQDVAAQEAVVEDEVEEVVVVVEGEALLPGLEEEAFAEFEEEVLEMVDDGGFEVGSRSSRPFRRGRGIRERAVP